MLVMSKYEDDSHSHMLNILEHHVVSGVNPTSNLSCLTLTHNMLGYMNSIAFERFVNMILGSSMGLGKDYRCSAPMSGNFDLNKITMMGSFVSASHYELPHISNVDANPCLCRCTCVLHYNPLDYTF